MRIPALMHGEVRITRTIVRELWELNGDVLPGGPWLRFHITGRCMHVKDCIEGPNLEAYCEVDLSETADIRTPLLKHLDEFFTMMNAHDGEVRVDG